MQLGERAGLPQSVISAYERGRRDPTLGSLARLVAAAGFDLYLDLVPRAAAPAPFTGPVGRRLQRRRDDARRLLAARDYGSPAVFGSVARGTDTDTSDIDLLIDLPAGVGLTQLIRTAIDLETLLGAPVDLVPAPASDPASPTPSLSRLSRCARRGLDRLQDIAEAIGVIRSHLARGGLDDGLVFDVVRIRLLEIGEAVKSLPADLLTTEPAIDWPAVARFRGHLVHHY